MAAPQTGLTSCEIGGKDIPGQSMSVPDIYPRCSSLLLYLLLYSMQVSREVRSIMNSPLPTVSYNTKSRSFQSVLPRREKRKSKSFTSFNKVWWQ